MNSTLRHDYPSADDVQLVGWAKNGDASAFEELVHRHRDKIYARAMIMMRNEEEAMDLSQEAWVKGWQRLHQFMGDSSFATWMTRIVINVCLDELRKKKRMRTESIEEMDEEEEEEIDEGDEEEEEQDLHGRSRPRPRLEEARNIEQPKEAQTA